MGATHRIRGVRARVLRVLVVSASLLVGCTGADDGTTTSLDPTSTTTTTSNPFGCVSAPEPERHSFSDFPLAINDNPVVGESRTVLSIGTPTSVDLTEDALPDDSGLTDLGAKWQCWTGAGWVETHVLMLDGDTITGFPGATTTSIAIGKPIPGAFEVVIPDVAPGWYTIAVHASGSGPSGTDNSDRDGYIAIEVVE